MGAQLAKEIASKTNDVAGDGTTTATVLGPGHRPRRHARTSPPAPTRWPSSAASRRAVEAAVADLRSHRHAGATGKDQIAQVATISATTRRSAT